jgi:L-ascorbate metabolism protein UlaG (beta-lactamase superfamily)
MAVTLKWLGHSCFQIQLKGKICYIDLYQAEPREKADLILVTHSHYDHLDAGLIKKVRKPGTVIIAPADCVAKIGGDVKSLKPGQETSVGDVTVRAVEAYNVKRFRSPGNPFHPKGFGVGYVLKIAGKMVYHAGDTDFIPEMKQLGHVDVALIPSGGTYTMDNADAVEAALTIDATAVIPMHRWDTDPEEFKKVVESRSKIRVVVLQKDQEYQVV